MPWRHTKTTGQPARREEVHSLPVLFFFATYFINVLLGKINILYSLNLPHLGSVAEFLLLFAACILLIIAAIKRESAEKILLTQTKKE